MCVCNLFIMLMSHLSRQRHRQRKRKISHGFLTYHTAQLRSSPSVSRLEGTIVSCLQSTLTAIVNTLLSFVHFSFRPIFAVVRWVDGGWTTGWRGLVLVRAVVYQVYISLSFDSVVVCREEVRPRNLFFS